MSGPLMAAASLAAALDVVLAVVLLGIWGFAYRRVRARVTWGLLVAALMFLLQNIVTVGAYVWMTPEISSGFAPVLLAISTIEAGALGALNWTALT